jgi:hypothetical protein
MNATNDNVIEDDSFAGFDYSRGSGALCFFYQGRLVFKMKSSAPTSHWTLALFQDEIFPKAGSYVQHHQEEDARIPVSVGGAH